LAGSHFPHVGIGICGAGVWLRYLSARAPRSEKIITKLNPWGFWLVIGALVVVALIVGR
jgi:hypothetical protein